MSSPSGPGTSTRSAELSGYQPRLAPGGVTPWVFYPSLVLVAAVCVLAMVFPDRAGEVLETVQQAIVGTFGWYYVVIVALFVIFSISGGISSSTARSGIIRRNWRSLRAASRRNHRPMPRALAAARDPGTSRRRNP
jgi:hypothetical protein